MGSKKNGVFDQKHLIRICISRIITQDRDGRLPMRVINKILNHPNDPYDCRKEWRKAKEEYVKRTILITNNDNANNDNTKKITLSEVVTLEIKAQPSAVTFKDKNGIEHDLFSEVFRRGQNGGIYEVIKTDAIKNITLDHSIPVSCILELKHDDFPTIEELNRQYDEYVNKKPGKSPSKLAAEFAPCNINKQRLLQEMKNLFKYGQLTIMERRSNVSKNNYFSYCSVNEWSNCPHFKKRYKDLFK